MFTGVNAEVKRNPARPASSLGSSGAVRGKGRLLVNRRAQWHPFRAFQIKFCAPADSGGLHGCPDSSRQIQWQRACTRKVGPDPPSSTSYSISRSPMIWPQQSQAVLLPRPPNILPDAGGSCPVRTRSRITVRNCSSSMGSRAQVQKETLVLAMVAADSFNTITTSG